MKKHSLGGLALAVSLGSLSPSALRPDPNQASEAEPGAPMACGAGKCGKSAQPSAETSASAPGADSKCGVGRCAAGRCGAAAKADSPRLAGPTLGTGEPEALLKKVAATLDGTRAALGAEDKAKALASLDELVALGGTLSRFDPAAVKAPEAVLFGRLEALRLNAGGTRSLAEGGHWRAARGSLAQVVRIVEGLYAPLGVEKTAAVTGTASPVLPASR